MDSLRAFAALVCWTALVLVLGVSALLASEDPAGWWPDTRLTDDTSASITSSNNARSIAVDTEGDVHVVWTDYRTGPARVYYKVFDGAAWTPDVAISPAGANASNPAIAADGEGGVHVVWVDYRNGATDLYYRTLHGSTWGAERRLTDAPGNSLCPSIAADDTAAVHVVWEDYRDSNWEVYYKRGFDDSVWTGDDRLTTAGGNSLYPSVAVGAGGSVHVVWQDSRDGNREIYYKHMTPLLGYDWSDDQRLTVSSGGSDTPCITADPEGNLYVFWEDTRDGNSEIYCKAYNGYAWGADQRLTSDTGSSITPNAAATNSGEIHIVWCDDRDGNEEIYYKHLGGGTWSDDIRLTQAGADSRNPSIATGPDHSLDVVWQDRRDNNFEIYWKRNSAVLLPPVRIISIEPPECPAGDGIFISNLAGEGFFTDAQVRLIRDGEPSIPATDIVVEALAKITCRISLEDAAPGAWDVVVRNIDGQEDTLKYGFNVLPTLWGDDTRLTSAAGASELSKPNARCLAADGLGNLHAVWFDTRDGNSEIYYKKYDGTSWGPDERLTTTGNASEYPALAVDDSNRVHVVWQELVLEQYQIFYKIFDGTSWGPNEMLTSSGAYSTLPSIAAGQGGAVHVVWQDERDSNWEVYYKRFDGSVWLDDERLTNTESVSGTPAVAVGTDGVVHVIWYEDLNYVGLSSEVRHRPYDGAWGPVETLATGKEIWTPSIAAGPNGSIHVAWHDKRYSSTDEHDVFYMAYDGLSWGERQQISDAPGTSSNSSVAVRDSSVYIFWADERREDTEIYYRLFDGAAWQAEVRLTFAAGESRFPSAAIDAGGVLHVIWQDRRSGNLEIYHKSRDEGILADIAVSTGIKVMDPIRVAPNPVRSFASLAFSISRPGESSVSIYSATGRLVRRWNLGTVAAGRHLLTWDGTDSGGGAVAPGVYFVRVAGVGSSCAKIIVLR
jgi:hypothetical protein